MSVSVDLYDAPVSSLFAFGYHPKCFSYSSSNLYDLETNIICLHFNKSHLRLNFVVVLLTMGINAEFYEIFLCIIRTSKYAEILICSIVSFTTFAIFPIDSNSWFSCRNTLEIHWTVHFQCLLRAPFLSIFFSCFICNFFFRAIIKEIHCIRKSRCKKRATTRTLNSFFVVADFLYIYSLLMDSYLTKNLHTMQRE